jgi:phosphopantetheinyl transferase (holo-ACP synthase)
MDRSFIEKPEGTKKSADKKRGADMAKNIQGIPVQTVDFSYGKGPVFCASLPCRPGADQRPAGPGTNGPDQKHHLICRLRDHLTYVKHPLWMHKSYDNQDAFPIQVVRIIRGPLGRPQLLVGEQQGPAISFSKSGKTLWAALCEDDCDIGIDVAQYHEFDGKYPFSRVFHPRELRHAMAFSGNDVKKGAALLWSIKEAVAKALGCGFHLVDPLQIIVGTATCGAAGETTEGTAEQNSIYDFPIVLSKKAARRFPMAKDRSLQVRSFSHGKMWLSIALLHRQPQ